MKHNKKYFFIVGISLIILFFLSVFIINNTDKNGLLDNKFVSYGNSYDYCIVEETTKSEKSIINKYKKYDFVKLDKIISIEEISYQQLSGIIYKTSNNEFKYGISLLNDKIVLLAEEINTNGIINYDTYSIDFENLNTYLESKGIKEFIYNIESLKIFETESKYLENNKFINLSMKNGYNRREIDKENLDEIINRSANTLKLMNLESGKFIYGFRTNTAKEITSYNILRHAGSTWSLIIYYENNKSDDLKKVIENAIDYLLENYLIKYDEEIYFVEEKKTSEIKLGGNALTLLMLSEYNRVFADNKYNEYAEKIANGIIFMQQEDGSYYHVLNLDGSLKDIYRTVYYDGEATYALLKFYQVSNKNKYLDIAKKTIDMFLEENYEKYKDHWVSYAMMEYIKYNTDEKYIDFAFNNYLQNRNVINSTNSFSPTRLELLLSTYRIYNYVYSKNLDSEAFKNFDISLLKESIEINLKVLFEYYISEEVAMYSSNPSKIIYGFHSVSDNFRMRIDDIQHSLVAIITYYNEFVK